MLRTMGYSLEMKAKLPELDERQVIELLRLDPIDRVARFEAFRESIRDLLLTSSIAGKSRDAWPPFHLHALLESLTAAGVEFVVIGGSAAVLHGSPTVTHDLDIVVDGSAENRRRMDSLSSKADSGRIDVRDLPPGGPSWNELRGRAESVELDGFGFRVAAIDDLIAMKKAAGRPKDLGAVAELEAIKRLSR